MSTVRGSLRGGSVGAPDVDLPAPLRKKMEERSGSDGGRSVDYKPSDRDPTLSRPPRPRIGHRASSSRVSAVVRAGCAAAALFAAFATGCGGHARTAGTILFQSDRSGRAARGVHKLGPGRQSDRGMGGRSSVASATPVLGGRVGVARVSRRLPPAGAARAAPAWGCREGLGDRRAAARTLDSAPAGSEAGVHAGRPAASVCVQPSSARRRA